ncbi:MAG: molybdenum cofactor biosynthesis protein [Thermomicrobiales bacterium]
MLVTVKYFAALREVVGQMREERDAPAGSTAGDLFEAIAADYPRIAPMRSSTMLMVNRAYVQPDHPLSDGDELALIPPVSGGADERFMVQEAPLDPRSVEALLDDPTTGALVTFIGRVRDHARGQGVSALDYEAYPEAAAVMMAQIADEIRERWGIGQVAIHHRTGLLRVGEASVVICVASAHRGEAFEASEYAIERLKEIVPVWKKEHYDDGATWIGSEADYQRESRSQPDASDGRH